MGGGERSCLNPKPAAERVEDDEPCDDCRCSGNGIRGPPGALLRFHGAAGAASAVLPGEDRRHPAAHRLDGAGRQTHRRERATRHRPRQPGRRREGLPGAVHPARRPGPADGWRGRREIPDRGRGREGADRHRVERRQPADPDGRGRAVEDADDQLLLDRSDLHDAGAGGQDRRLLLPHAADGKDAGLCQRQGGRRARLSSA